MSFVCRRGHFTVSFWYASLLDLTNTRFHSFISASDFTLRQRFQMTQGGYQVIIILPIKSKMAAAKKQCFYLHFLY